MIRSRRATFRTARRMPAIAVLVATAAGARTAPAQGPAPVAAHAEADGGAAYLSAIREAVMAKERALDVGAGADWREVLRLFRAAASIRATRECAYEIGVSSERLDRPDLAVEAYEEAIELGLAGAPRARAEAFLAARAPAVARLRVLGPDGARLSVAGIERGRLPLRRPLVLPPGDVEIEASFPSGAKRALSIHLESGSTRDLNLTPAPLPALAPPLAGAPAADIPLSTSPRIRPGWLIGSGAALAIAALAGLATAQDRIEAHRAGLREDCAGPVADDFCPLALAGHGPSAQEHVDGLATWKPIRTLSWIGLGAGVASAVVGTILQARAAPSAAPGLALSREGGRLTVGVGWGCRF